MRNYEIMVIVSPDVDDRQVQGVVEKPFEAFKAAGGTVDNVDIWGRRRLAYDIQKKSEGIYAVLNVTAEPAVVKELDRQLRLNEAVLRTNATNADWTLDAPGAIWLLDGLWGLMALEGGDAGTWRIEPQFLYVDSAKDGCYRVSLEGDRAAYIDAGGALLGPARARDTDF